MTKHIDIQHHFIRNLVEFDTLLLHHINTDLQLPHLFTKLLDFLRLESLSKAISVCVGSLGCVVVLKVGCILHFYSLCYVAQVLEVCLFILWYSHAYVALCVVYYFNLYILIV